MKEKFVREFRIHNFMEQEIKNSREHTKQLIELTRDNYRKEIEKKRGRIKRLSDRMKIQKKELQSLGSQIEVLNAQVKKHEVEADEYEFPANWVETAFERRSYLSRANRARREADKLCNRTQRLYGKTMKIRAEYDANREKIAELERR